MSELNAMLGLLQMPRLKMLNEWQVKNADRIIRELPDDFFVPKAPYYAKTVRYIIGCMMDREERREFLNKMTEERLDGRDATHEHRRRLVEARARGQVLPQILPWEPAMSEKLTRPSSLD